MVRTTQGGLEGDGSLNLSRGTGRLQAGKGVGDERCTGSTNARNVGSVNGMAL